MGMVIVNMLCVALGLLFSIVMIGKVCIINESTVTMHVTEVKCSPKLNKFIMSSTLGMEILLLVVFSVALLLGVMKGVDIVTFVVIGCVLRGHSIYQTVQDCISDGAISRGKLLTYKVVDVLLSITIVLCILQYLIK